MASDSCWSPGPTSLASELALPSCSSAELSVEFATYWRALGQEERAHKAYLEALSARDTFAPAYLGLARLALKAKQMPQAREHLTRYLTLSPRGADADWARRQLESK